MDFADTRPTFTLMVRHVGMRATSAPRVDHSFWDLIRLHAQEANLDGVFEDRIYRRLGPALVEAARRYRRRRLVQVKGVADDVAPADFYFKVLALRQGSLEVSLAVLGLPALVQYLFNDPVVVAEFLEFCAGEAFFDAIQVQAGTLDPYFDVSVSLVGLFPARPQVQPAPAAPVTSASPLPYPPAVAPASGPTAVLPRKQARRPPRH